MFPKEIFYEQQLAMWVCYAQKSDDESYIGIPDKLLGECTEILESRPNMLPLTFTVKIGTKQVLIGMTEFVQGNNLYLPNHILELLQVNPSDKVKLQTYRREVPVLKTLHMKPLDWQFYDESNHTYNIEKALKFFPTLNVGSVLPVKFGNLIVRMQVVKLMDVSNIAIDSARISHTQEVNLEFESNDILFSQYEQKIKERNHIAKMDSWNRAWEYIQQGRPVFGMSDDLRKFIREKSIMSKIVK